MTAPLRLFFDNRALADLLAELSAMLAKLPGEIVGAFDGGTKLICVETDRAATAATGHFVMRAKPSDLLLGFMAAAGARNPDLSAVEDALCHIEASLSNGGSVA
jgi:hypothetical protein